MAVHGLYETTVLVWIALTSLIAFVLVGIDKRAAVRKGVRRVPELTLILLGAIGGWLGGFIGMLWFRHKTRKLTFHLKYAAALIVFAGWLFLYWLKGFHS